MRHTRLKAWDFFWQEHEYKSGVHRETDARTDAQAAFLRAANTLATTTNLTTDQIYAISELAASAFRIGKEIK